MSKPKEIKIAYEPHPITPERKTELRRQGFRIVDARFKPASLPTVLPPPPVEKPRLSLPNKKG